MITHPFTNSKFILEWLCIHFNGLHKKNKATHKLWIVVNVYLW